MTLVNTCARASIASAIGAHPADGTDLPQGEGSAKSVSKVVSDKHEDVMAKLGAILSPRASSMLAAANVDGGAAVAHRPTTCRPWWHAGVHAVLVLVPVAHFLSLAFTPTCLVALSRPAHAADGGALGRATQPYAYRRPLRRGKREDREKGGHRLLLAPSHGPRQAKRRRRRRRMTSSRRRWT